MPQSWIPRLEAAGGGWPQPPLPARYDSVFLVKTQWPIKCQHLQRTSASPSVDEHVIMSWLGVGEGCYSLGGTVRGHAGEKEPMVG